MSVVKAEMPNGAVVWFRHEDHAYFLRYDRAKGKCAGRIPGISNVSKCNGQTSFDGLVQWAVNLANNGTDWKEERDRLGGIGQGAHDVLECLARGLPCEAGTLQERAVQTWWNHAELDAIDIEQIVYSPMHNFAGRFDLFASHEFTPQLWDLKTGSMKPEYFIQLNLYEIARREVGFIPAKELWILHIDKQGGAREIPVPIQPDWALNALAIFNTGKVIRSAISKAQRTADLNEMEADKV